MENMYDKLLVMRKNKLETKQMIIENNIKAENDHEIVKVLAIDAGVDIDSSQEIGISEQMISGKVVCNLVYLNENEEINSTSTFCSFNYKISDKQIKSGTRLNVKATVIGNDINKIMNNHVKIISTLNFDAVVVANDEVQYLKDAGVNTYTKQKECSVNKHSIMLCEKFGESLFATVKTGVKKILMSSIDCLIKDWSCGPNFVAVECELYGRVLYVDNQENAELQTITMSKNIKQEIEVGGLTKNCSIDLFVQSVKDSINVVIEEKDGETKIELCADIMVCLNSYECEKILCVEDAYSAKEVISITNDEYKNTQICKPEILEDKVEGSVSISMDQPRIDKYLATTNACISVSNAYIKNKEMIIEGIITANVIYLNDEIGGINSVEIEIPFVLDKKTDLVDGCVLEPNISLFDADTMVKRGREIYFDAKLRAYVNACCDESISFITKLDSMGEIEDRKDAIEIYFGKAGESFWEIAKNLKIPSEVIRNQNPELVDPLEKDQNIALYFQKDRKIQ